MDAMEPTVSVDLVISGMSCQGCVERVEKALAGVAGLERADVQLGRAHLELYPQVITTEKLQEMIEVLGYTIPVLSERHNPFQRFLARMIENNEKTFKGERLDCCTMIKR